MIVNLNKPESGDIPFRKLTFPDGQPHCEFDQGALNTAADKGAIDIVVSIRSGVELLDMALVIDAIRSALLDKSAPITLNISYLLGARMDRRIAPGQPASLAVIASVLNTVTMGLHRVRILDPHSPVTLSLMPQAEVLHPDLLVAYALSSIEREHGRTPVVVIPDKGAVSRTNGILSRLGTKGHIAQCSKQRDSQTGKLSGFQLDTGDVKGKDAVIVDDICDGGGTFSGISKVLRAHGARYVYLCVTHGIFSKGLDIAGIDGIFSTDSYHVPDQTGFAVDRDIDDNGVLRYRIDGRTRLILMTNFMMPILSARRSI